MHTVPVLDGLLLTRPCAKYTTKMPNTAHKYIYKFTLVMHATSSRPSGSRTHSHARLVHSTPQTSVRVVRRLYIVPGRYRLRYSGHRRPRIQNGIPGLSAQQVHVTLCFHRRRHRHLKLLQRRHTDPSLSSARESSKRLRERPCAHRHHHARMYKQLFADATDGVSKSTLRKPHRRMRQNRRHRRTIFGL